MNSTIVYFNNYDRFYHGPNILCKPHRLLYTFYRYYQDSIILGSTILRYDYDYKLLKILI